MMCCVVYVVTYFLLPCQPTLLLVYPYLPLSYTLICLYIHRYIPHPMIVSQVWALLGFYKAAHFRQELGPYVIPVHIVLYIIHMLQEHFDIYKRYPKDTIATTTGGVTTEKHLKSQ